jgi:hypothetical protein
MNQGEWLGSWSGEWFGTVGEADPNAMVGSASFSITANLSYTPAGFIVGSASFSFSATGEISAIGISNDLIPIHGWIKDKKRKEILPPTAEEIEAERIRLGIVEAKNEIKQVVKLIKQVEAQPQRTQSSLDAQKLAIHKKLLAEQINRANDEYQALLDRINKNYLRARLETHKAIKRQQAEEGDIAFIMSMLASI